MAAVQRRLCSRGGSCLQIITKQFYDGDQPTYRNLRLSGRALVVRPISWLSADTFLHPVYFIADWARYFINVVSFCTIMPVVWILNGCLACIIVVRKTLMSPVTSERRRRPARWEWLRTVRLRPRTPRRAYRQQVDTIISQIKLIKYKDIRLLKLYSNSFFA